MRTDRYLDIPRGRRWSRVNARRTFRADRQQAARFAEDSRPHRYRTRVTGLSQLNGDFTTKWKIRSPIDRRDICGTKGQSIEQLRYLEILNDEPFCISHQHREDSQPHRNWPTRLCEFNVVCRPDHRYSVVITHAACQPIDRDGKSEFKSTRRRTAAGHSGRSLRYPRIRWHGVLCRMSHTGGRIAATRYWPSARI